MSDSPAAQFRVAQMLAHHGLVPSAIRLYREASEKVPFAPEPYVASLELAAGSQDVATARWAATQILSQAWVNHHDQIYQTARARTLELAAGLREQARTQEAQELIEAVRQADNRDLVVRLTWQGEADLDLRVLEPLGTVCYTQNRVTAAGGVLVRDAAGKDPGSGRNQAELYICARALPGNYEIRLKRIWGNPVQGRAKIEIIYQEGTANQRQETKYVSVNDDQPLIVQLDAGQRTELLPVAQFVPPPRNAGEAKLPIQQLRALAQSQPQGPYTGPQHLAQVGGGVGAVVGGGAVAFDPTITQFFIGAGLSAQAVVSADRRYVRLNIVPFFNTLAGEKRFTVSGAVGGVGGGGIP
jgi:hypothetical protein